MDDCFKNSSHGNSTVTRTLPTLRPKKLLTNSLSKHHAHPLPVSYFFLISTNTPSTHPGWSLYRAVWSATPHGTSSIIGRGAGGVRTAPLPTGPLSLKVSDGDGLSDRSSDSPGSSDRRRDDCRPGGQAGVHVDPHGDGWCELAWSAVRGCYGWKRWQRLSHAETEVDERGRPK